MYILYIMITSQDVFDGHMKNRCSCITVLCTMSFYDWVTLSWFDPLVIDYWSISFVNLVCFGIYLIWDAWSMIFGNNNIILYRGELIVHHIVSFLILTLIGGYCAPSYSSRLILAELISIFNYVLRDKSHELYLHWYRIAIIFLCRLPIYIFPTVLLVRNPHLFTEMAIRLDMSINNTIMFIVVPSSTCFIIYDVVLLRKIFGILRKKTICVD